MIVRQIPVGPMKNLDYLVMDETSMEAIVVDSGWETGPVVAAAKAGGMRVRYVVATHGHFDHVETIAELAGKLGAQTLTLGGARVSVIHTPGHTQDSICLYDGKNLFTGDTLFIGNCGRTDLPGGSTSELFHSLHAVLMALPGETMIYPGHDYGDVRSRRLGEEAKLNPTLLARNLREFTGVE
jgi:hydroxyacylglutathione hydrolase